MNKTNLFLLVLMSCIGLLSPSVYAAAGDMSVSGNVTAGSFSGDGSGLSNISSAVYKKTVMVSPIGTASQNGETLRSALAGITTASATNPILLKIEPGIYDIGSTSGITMKEYVDIEGSGEKTTKITGSFANTTPSTPTSGTINGVSNAELRFLTVENNCTNGCVAIQNPNASPSILHVTVSASGDDIVYGIFNGGIPNPIISHSTITATASSNTGTAYGIFNLFSAPIIIYTTVIADNGATSYGIFNSSDSSPIISHTTAIAKNGTDSYGIYNNNATPTLIAVNAKAESGTNNYGMYNVSSSPVSKTINIDRSVFEGETKSIFNVSEYTLNISSSKVIGGIATGGTTKCVGVASYNGTSVSNVRCRLGPSPP